ncbi:MAG: exodeoxyribonuclease VII large subunit, partial [Clostridiales bacterium]|nr:exodeoxyribonuclease VII large subunit [Clostridiales bacterium]
IRLMRRNAMAANLELTVSQLNEYVRRMFQMDPMLRAIELKGEISNLKFHQSGALFFTMKDENASISCVMYSGDVDGLQAMPFEGMRAVASGSVALYVRGGQCQFVVKGMRAQGVGVLYERLQMLKEKLGREGLFEPERKRALPPYPDTIGVVSSPTGAVIHDILNVSLRRNPDAHILLCPVRVQGIGADEEVVEAIHLLERLEHVSVIIVARGGGSMEDLWTFNEERVVRAVAMCKKPIVSAVGHETDVTLCDLAADLRAPTPSAAAECVVPVRDEMLNKIKIMRRQMQESARNAVAERQNALKLAQIKLSANHPSLTIRRQEERLAQRMDALLRAAERQIQNRQTRLETQTAALELLSPYAALKRGYAIVQNAGRAISKAGGLCVGDEVTVRFADGVIHAEVLSKEESHGEETDV